jgi:hypothetical protein
MPEGAMASCSGLAEADATGEGACPWLALGGAAGGVSAEMDGATAADAAEALAAEGGAGCSRQLAREQARNVMA